MRAEKFRNDENNKPLINMTLERYSCNVLYSLDGYRMCFTFDSNDINPKI